MPYHHQVLGLVALVPNAARQLERTREAPDRGRRLRIRKVGLAAAVVRLHRHQIGECRVLADFDGLLVESDRLVVEPGAPRNRSEMVKRVGRRWRSSFIARHSASASVRHAVASSYASARR